MAYIKLYEKKLAQNFNYLNSLFKENSIEWAIVTKLFCGNKDYLSLITKLDIEEVCDSRISNLKLIKSLNPKIQTVYIKPPAKRSIKNLVKYADVSFNSELETIRWISEEAKKQNKTHKIIIMIELGDLREGIMGEELLDFYKEIFNLPNIKITGIGSNLNCLYGVMPSADKLIQLSLYKQLIDATFNKNIPWVTGGTSVVIPLLLRKELPKGINHFRIGETLFFGNNLIDGETLKGMNNDVFELVTEIIEIHEKPKVPQGIMQENPSGESFEIDEAEYGKTSFRALIDVGVLDISDPNFMIPIDSEVEIVGASSDMIVVDLGDNKLNRKVGDLLKFKLKYMGALRVFNSKYIDKKIV